MGSKLNKKVLVFGSSGLIGKQLIAQLVERDDIETITVVNRKKQDYSNPKVIQWIHDLTDVSSLESKFDVDMLFLCLGTTIKKAGSQEKFEDVDLKLPVQIAKIAKRAGVERVLMISSMGADFTSSNFYLRTKGKAENKISEVGIPKTYFVRPSLLLGNRKEKRFGEKIASIFMKSLSFLFVGPLKKYKAIQDTVLAKAMIEIMFSDKESGVFENDQLLIIGS